MKTKVAILFGGISAEHEVSIMSANSVMENTDKERFEVIPVKISRSGEFDIEKVKEADVVFPCLHGKGGEDGSIQKLLESLNKKYVGCGAQASIVGLDKIAQKQIYEKLNIPTPPFQFFSKAEWQKSPAKIMNEIILPVFVKPVNTGSSIGITKVKVKEDLQSAIKEALKYDDRVIVEKAIGDFHEIEVSVLGNNDLTVSVPGEILPAEEFYSYDAKYKLDSGLEIPAKISEETTKEIQGLAEKVFRALGLRGMSRVDFFIEKESGKIYVNEVNTIPGFTKISMYPKLLEASGISYKDLITKLIELANE